MNPRVRVIRFARVTEPAGSAGGEIISQIWLDDSVVAASTIARSAAGWQHQLNDGTATGLVSTLSRQDLERQIVLYHLGPLSTAADDNEVATKDWFAAAS